jgi:hypothetical protein
MWKLANTSIDFGDTKSEHISGSIVYEDGYWKCGDISY